MRPVSEATTRIASKNFSRKYIALGRLVGQWPEIMGEEFASKTQPLKIHYRKHPKEKGATATLDIATSSANATILNYQKGLIIERINRLFGDTKITNIKFIASEQDITLENNKKTFSPLTQSEKKYLSDTLGEIEDPEIKEKLEKFGKALLMDQKK